MDWLQKILENAVYGDDGKLNVENTMKKINEEAAKHIVAKEQYNTKVKELDAANDTIKDLKKSNEDNEELQKTIKAHEATIKQLQKDHEAELKGMKIDSAITKILADNKAKHPDLLAGKFDREKLLVTDDGKVTGLDDQLKGLKEIYKDMFTQTVAGREPNNPDSKPTGDTTFESLVNDADTMSAEEVAARFAAIEKK
ncbi:MAG: phage scaffolding protein [Citrobacter sp.]|nr:phage scaffolding protein [Citrobacter sp.]